MAKLHEQEITALRNCETKDDYADIARNIKRMHGGAYPEDWYRVVLAPGGVADELKAKWGDPHAFDIHAGTPAGKI